MMIWVMNQTLQLYQLQQQSTQVNTRMDKMEDMFIKFMKKSNKIQEEGKEKESLQD